VVVARCDFVAAREALEEATRDEKGQVSVVESPADRAVIVVRVDAVGLALVVNARGKTGDRDAAVTVEDDGERGSTDWVAERPGDTDRFDDPNRHAPAVGHGCSPRRPDRSTETVGSTVPVAARCVPLIRRRIG
jgi:hypothetical protein